MPETRFGPRFLGRLHAVNAAARTRCQVCQQRVLEECAESTGQAQICRRCGAWWGFTRAGVLCWYKDRRDAAGVWR